MPNCSNSGVLLGVQLDPPHQRGLKAVQEANDAFVLRLGIDPDSGKVIAHLVAQNALHQVQVVINKRWCLGRIGTLFDLGPEADQEANVRAQIFFAGPIRRGANDKAATDCSLFADQNALQTLALLVGGNLPRHTHMIHRRHEDQKAAGKRDVTGDARTLLRNRFLGYLHQDFLPLLQQLTDNRQVAGLGILPPSIVAAAAIIARPSPPSALIVALPASRLPGNSGYLPFFFCFLRSLGGLQLIFGFLFLYHETGRIHIGTLIDVRVAHHVADRAAQCNLLVEGLLFQFLKVVVFALDVERREVVLLFVGDLFLFHQPHLGRSVFQVILKFVEVALGLHAPWGLGFHEPWGGRGENRRLMAVRFRAQLYMLWQGLLRFRKLLFNQA